MKTVAIIQARMGSERLPGKVRMALCACPRKGGQEDCLSVGHAHSVLASVIRRARRAVTVDEVMVATSELQRDDVVAEIAGVCGVRVFRGSETDVLSRYVGAATMADATILVRLTADCPLVDPAVIDQTVRSLRMSGYDFASTSAEGYDPETESVRRTFPRGLDVEACWVDVLYRCDRLFASPGAREHVFTGIYRERPDLFLIRYIRDSEDHGMLNWCVDIAPDLEYVRRIYDDVDYRVLIERIEGKAA